MNAAQPPGEEGEARQMGVGTGGRGWFRSIVSWSNAGAYYVAAAASVVVTFIRLLATYPDFVGTAIASWSALLLFLLNIFMTCVIVYVISKALKPEGRIWHALIIGLSFQALLSSDIRLDNAELPGATAAAGSEQTTVNIRKDVYAPLEAALFKSADRPVEDAVGCELRQLVSRYPGRRGPGRLRTRVTTRLEEDRTLKRDERARVLRSIGRIVRARDVPEHVRIRQAGLKLYDHGARDVVQTVIARAARDKPPPKRPPRS